MLNKSLFLLLFLGLSTVEIYSMNNKEKGAETQNRNKSIMKRRNSIDSTRSLRESFTPPNLCPLPNRSYVKMLDNKINNGIEWAGNNPWTALGVSAACCLIGYKIFERPIKDGLENAKNYCEDKFWEALIKWERVKEEGLTKRDYIKGLVALLVSAGVVGGVYRYGPDNTMNLIKKLPPLLVKFKIEIGAGLLGILLARWLYQLKLSYENRQSRVMNFDNFLAQLTDDQRRLIFNSEELLVAVGRGGDNQAYLLNDPLFMKLLTPPQRKNLETIAKYRGHAVRDEA